MKFLTIIILAFFSMLYADDLLDSYKLEYQKKYPEALALMEKLGNEDPNEYLYQLRSGWLTLLNAEYTKSIDYYRKAQLLAPDSIEPKLGILQAQRALGQSKLVETTCRTILKQDPKNYTARTYLAFALYQLGNFREARKIYESVVADFPSDLEMILGVGWSYLKEGDKQKSKETFNRALKVAPQNARAQEGLFYAGK
jgi:tetratricopeptide (TPR) repeat protein